jgi:hypothetical protein
VRFITKLILLVGLIVLSAANSAQAETDFPVIGGSGNGSFEDRCPPGEFLTGIQGRAGAWTDEIQIVCQRIYGLPDPRDSSRIARYFFDGQHIYLGAPRGGGGGGAITASCTASEVVGLYEFMTDENRQVKAFVVSCNGKNGGQPFEVGFNLKSNTTGTNYNFRPNAPGNQRCPSDEVGVGLRGRYGEDVNAMSLICNTFNVPPPPPDIVSVPIQFNQQPPSNVGGILGNGVGINLQGARTPTPVRSSLPIKITGVGTSAVSQRSPSLFDGRWIVNSNTSRRVFELNVLLLGSGTLFGEFTDGRAMDKGTLRGNRSDTLHAHLTFQQPGINQSGTIDIALSSDGASFTGSGTLANNQPVAWRGTKQSLAK